MKFDIDVFLDACCEERGNYASNDMGFLPKPVEKARKFLEVKGWKVLNWNEFMGIQF